MRRPFLLLFFGLILFHFFGTNPCFAQKSNATAQSLIEQIRRKYAPDRRTAIFQAVLDSGKVVGKTNTPQAKQALFESLKANGYAFTDAFRVLPEAEVGEESYGYINLSVANMRSAPKDPNELVSQALLGTPVRIWEKDKRWYLVQTPDHYIAWIEYAGIERMTKAEFDAYGKKNKIIYTKPYGFSYQSANENAATVSDLVWGDVLAILDTNANFYHVLYPDGRKAFVAKNEVQLYDDWFASLKTSEAALVKSATMYMGLPYLWGGTSFKGVDCSGFTRMIYQMNGLYLPRDASQQANVGDPVDTSNNFDNLKVGDLLFFGEKAHDDKPERITHVGMWIGNMQFIQAAGMVKISSFDKNIGHLDAFNLGRFVKAKRILGSQNGIVHLKPKTVY